MITRSSRRLPGIVFETEAPQRGQALPRMDVAAFVGFAASGPVDVPVAVEDIGRFRDVFGDDQPLVWDTERGAPVSAHLAPAVETFFRNGGRRCWIVRVAESPVRNAFPVRGLIAAPLDENASPAWGQPLLACARSPGSWSDDLQLGAVLEIAAVDMTDAVLQDDGTFTVDFRSTAITLRAGDLVRLAFGDDVVALFRIEEAGLAIADASTAATISGGATVLRATGGTPQWFRHDPDLSAPVAFTAGRLLRAGFESSEPLSSGSVVSTGDDADPYEVKFDAAPGVTPETGDVIDLELSTGGAQVEHLWVAVGDVTDEADTDSPPEAALTVLASESLWPLAADSTTVAAATTPTGLERLRFEIIAWRDEIIEARLGQLGFAEPPETTTAPPEIVEAAARFWGRVPTDDALFRLRSTGQPETPPERSVETDAFEPRFPFAAGSTPALMMPLGMPTRPSAASARERRLQWEEDGAARTATASALERDGLAEFDAGLFVDDELGGFGLARLRAESDRRRLEELADGTPFRGLHALYPVEEVALVAVPDAIHCGWSDQAPLPLLPLDAPVLAVAFEMQTGAMRAEWSTVTAPDTVTYELEESFDHDFSDAGMRYEGDETTTRWGEEVVCPRRRFYRVRARMGGRLGPWSNTGTLLVGGSAFDACIRPLAGSTLLSFVESGSTPEPELRWSAVAGATAYVLAWSTDPTFAVATAQSLPASGLTVAEIDGTPTFVHPLTAAEGETRFLRVRAATDKERGPWSNTVAQPPSLGASALLNDSSTFDDAGLVQHLIAVQRSLLRFCAARGDALAVLSMPAHFRDANVFAHVAALGRLEDDASSPSSGDVAAGVLPLNYDELRALSFGALYHPWVGEAADSAGTSVTFRPPDGAVVGAMAARTLRDGAWAAPANDTLDGALALSQSIERDRWLDLLDLSVNVVRPDPRGIRVMSADTLALTDDLRPIGTRRLLILLVRLLVREGRALVFESNDDNLRWRLSVQFRDVLGRLFERGAFAGEVPSEAFLVRADRTNNPAASVDQGRLIVEIQVAPARPLEFLTVRLVQQDAQAFVEEES